MNQRHRLAKNITLFIMFAGMSACSNYFYYPINQHVLEFKEKGDVNLNVGTDGTLSTGSLGYAFTDHVALVSDYKEIEHNNWVWDNEVVLYKRYDVCSGCNGYVMPAVNIGYGFGKLNTGSEIYQLDVHRQTIQPSFGYKNNFLEVAFALRVARVNHDLHEGPDYLRGIRGTPPEEAHQLYDVGTRAFYFTEPSVMISLGYKPVRLRWQYISANNISPGKIKFIENTSVLSLNFTFK